MFVGAPKVLQHSKGRYTGDYLPGEIIYTAMPAKPKIRIAIDCRITDPRQGIGTAVMVFASALSRSLDVGQEYTFVVPEALKNWLAPHISGPCRLQTVPPPQLTAVKAFLRELPLLRRIWSKLRSAQPLPSSDGYVESAGFDVVHFPTQAAYLTGLPSIYQPWDLQHLHYPEFFKKEDWIWRDKLYRAFCKNAAYVCVQTKWTKQDLIAQYELAEDKVVVIPWGSVFEAYALPSLDLQEMTARKYRFPDQFFFYPAVTWPHKNHEVILRALSLLRTKYQRIAKVYFTGASTAFRLELDVLASELGVSEQIHFLGFVSPEELQAIFKMATAMIFPSKFEGFGLPLLEAFQAGTPVLCSNATVLPEVAGDGALYFDPDSPEDLASLMIEMLTNLELREILSQKGAAVLSNFGIDDTVRMFQSLYERTAVLRNNDNDILKSS